MGKTREQLKRDSNLLLCVLEKKHIDYEIKDNNVMLVFKHNKPIERGLQWLFKRPAISDIELDSMGSRAWLSMDGINTVYDIGRILENEFGQECQPVYKRLARYIKYMLGQGWIGIRKDKN